jgi:hypothetical protein
MTIKFNVPGKERKRLVLILSEWLGREAVYSGAPSFDYKIGDDVKIDRHGVATGISLDPEAAERLLEHLYDEGIEYEVENGEEPERGGIAVQIPAAELTEMQLLNLHSIIEAKGKLIKKALGIDSLPVNRVEDRLEFPWFPGGHTPEEAKAYMNFVSALCRMASELKRTTAKEKEVENEKYAFRCFLLRLGFIGSEYKTDRKILLRRLEGSSAFKAPKPKEVTE